MATNIGKALYPAPAGLDAGADSRTTTDVGMGGFSDGELEIDIVNPDMVTLDDGSVEITIIPGKDTAGDFGANLAEEMDEGELQKIASDLIGEIDSDITSRKEWVEMYVRGLEVLGMKYEERTEPWNGACGVYSTVLTEAAIRFQSEIITETFPAQGPVKTKIVGAINKLTEEIAERVREDMNYKLTDEMPEYRPEHERMLYSLGLAGSAFKKVYFDPSLGRQVAMFIPAEDLIIPYGASNVMTSERVTHTMRKTKNEIRKLQVSGFYCEVDLGEPTSIHTDIEKKKAEDQGFSLTDDDRYQILEVHADYDLPGYEDENGIALPYVITIDRASSKVLAIRRNWNNDDDLRAKRNHFVQYTYIPGFGVYGLGLIHIIGGYARAGTSLIRQLVDAGTLSNLPGGLKARGLRIKGDDTPIAPGEFRDVDVASGTVRDNIMPLPYKEPSQVLMALLNQITEEARRLGSVADMKIGDMSGNAPVGTTLAILERQLKTMSAVQARVHFSMKEEFKLLKDIIRDNTPSSYDYEPIGGDRKLKQSDYDLVNVIPVSDPNSATMAQRIMQYQAVIQLSQTAPQIYDLPHLHRQMIEVLGIKNADKLIPLDEDQKPKDPVFENMAIINMKPVKAFQYQDHQAHIQVHMSAMQDPVIMKMIGQNPQAQAMQAAMMSHIAEHVAFSYRQRIEQQMGIALPPEGEDLPPQVELALSGMMAQAAQQVLQENQAQAAQQQAQQQAQDPVVQMQQQELQIKQGELKLKEKKLEVDAAARADELELKQQALGAKMELDGFKAGRQSQQADKKLQADLERDGVRMGIEIAKTRQGGANRGE